MADGDIFPACLLLSPAWQLLFIPRQRWNYITMSGDTRLSTVPLVMIIPIVGYDQCNLLEISNLLMTSKQHFEHSQSYHCRCCSACKHFLNQIWATNDLWLDLWKTVNLSVRASYGLSDESSESDLCSPSVIVVQFAIQCGAVITQSIFSKILPIGTP